MTLKVSISRLIATATQGGADAFVQATITTGLTGRQAYSLKGIAVEFTTALVGANAAEYELAVTRRSKTAMPLLSDPDVIHKFRFQNVLTTSGMHVWTKTLYHKPELEVPLVEEFLYVQFDSASSSAANTAIVGLDVELDTISDLDRLSLITRSLS